MAVVWISSMMRDLTGGRDRVRAPGGTVAGLVEELENAYPGFKNRFFVQGQLAPGIMATARACLLSSLVKPLISELSLPKVSPSRGPKLRQLSWNSLAVQVV
jgi:hypothetical protein